MDRGILADLRHAVRALARRPLASGLAAATLALGIGAGTAVFSVVNGVLLRPLAYSDSAGLVAVFEDARAVDGGPATPTSPATFADWASASRTLVDWTAAHPWSPSLTGRDRPDRLSGLKATPGLFDLLGARPLLGRVFHGRDGEPGHVVVLGYELWQGRFGGGRDIVGQSLVLDGAPYEVVGVMPPGFRFPPFWATEAGFWAPLQFEGDSAQQRRARFLRSFARLAPGASLEEARAELELVGRRLAAAHPETLRGVGVNVQPLQEPVVAPVRPALLALLGAVVLLGLVACANVSHLLLAMAMDRSRELAVRLALGASRRRLLLLTLAESLTLAAAGMAGGLLLGRLGLAGLLALAPPDLPRLGEIALDRAAVAFACGAALGCALLTGLLPALRAAGVDPARQLGGGRGSSGPGRARSSALLVSAEVAVALCLACGAGLLVHSFLRQSRRDAGVATAGVVTQQVSLGGSPLGEAARMPSFLAEAEERVARLPGVEATGFLIFPHVGGDLWQFPYHVEGRPEPPPNARPAASVKVATAGAFPALGVPLLRGRGFSERDTAGAPPVVLVNRTLARREWGEGDPVGRRLEVSGRLREVIGVVGDVVQDDLTQAVLPEIYFPYSQDPVPFYKSTTLVVRGPGHDLAAAASRCLWGLDPDLPVSDVRSMASILARSLARARFTTALGAAFAAASVLLAGVGLFGVVSYGVGRRRRELAIRAALGASRGSLLATALGGALRAAALGVLLGAVGAVALGRALGSLLYDVGAADPLSLGAALATLGWVAATGGLAAWRSGRVPPATALQAE